MNFMKKNVDVLVGLQWGDEGKGKIVDLLAPQYDVVARFQGGPNAGHTLEFDNQKFVLHTIPSGIFQPKTINYIGNGVVLDPCVFKAEVDKIVKVAPWIYDQLYISKHTHLILPTHRLLDAAYEQARGNKKIGSTLKGIGPTYTDKISRNGIRVGDLSIPNFKYKYQKLVEKHKQIMEMLHFSTKDLGEMENNWFEALNLLLKFKQTDNITFIQQHLHEGKGILAEGAQGTMLDVDFGSYPFVTSSNTIAAAACTGMGIGPQQIGDVIGVAKAYCTRVGNGPFPTEINDDIGNELRLHGNEFGSTTGRPRRCGWLDLVALKFAITINGVNRLIITKVDVMSSLDEIKIAIAYRTNDRDIDYIPYSYDDIKKPVYKTFKGWKKNISNVRKKDELPVELLKYLHFIEDYTNVKINILSVGPNRDANVIF